MADHPRQPNHAETTSTQLIDRLKSKDDDAWTYFEFAYRPLIVRWAIRDFGVAAADAEDVAGDVVASVVKGLDGFKKSNRVGAFRKWLKTITQRRASDFYRGRAKTPSPEGGTQAVEKISLLPETGSSETQTLAVDEEALLVQRTLSYLKSRVKETTFEAFHRVVVQGQEPKSVADDLGIAVNSVHQACSRMLNRSRKLLEGELDWVPNPSIDSN